MRRRAFITLLGGAAGPWPIAPRPAQAAMPVIGYLGGGTADGYAPYVASFRKALGENGFIEGRNVVIEFLWAEGNSARLPAMATELVRRPVNVILAAGTTPVVLAAKAASATIPIVFSVGSDPVLFGLVASLNRPGGN